MVMLLHVVYFAVLYGISWSIVGYNVSTNAYEFSDTTCHGVIGLQ
jgi:hypothetical protein